MNYVNTKKLKFKGTFLNLPRKPFLKNILKFNKIFLKDLKIYQLNIVKKINKDYKKACEWNENCSNQEKEKNQQYSRKC